MELAIVIPVFNEAKTIEALIRDLSALTIAEGISCQFIIINDGSTDSSLAVLNKLVADIPNLQLISNTNRGHGPSLLIGYQLALEHDWVFQIDSDYEYDIAALPILWKNRQNADLLIAERDKRNASFLRDIATGISQSIVTLLYGTGIRDTNAPFRLIRTCKLAKALPYIDASCFAPNILITAFFLKNKFRTFSSEAHLKIKSDNKISTMSNYMLKGCIKTFTDLLYFRTKI